MSFKTALSWLSCKICMMDSRISALDSRISVISQEIAQEKEELAQEKLFLQQQYSPRGRAALHQNQGVHQQRLQYLTAQRQKRETDHQGFVQGFVLEESPTQILPQRFPTTPQTGPVIQVQTVTDETSFEVGVTQQQTDSMLHTSIDEIPTKPPTTITPAKVLAVPITQEMHAVSHTAGAWLEEKLKRTVGEYFHKRRTPLESIAMSTGNYRIARLFLSEELREGYSLGDPDHIVIPYIEDLYLDDATILCIPEPMANSQMRTKE